MSIPEYLDKIKRGGGGNLSLFYMAIIVLVGLSSFGLGRLSVDRAESPESDSVTILGAQAANPSTFSRSSESAKPKQIEGILKGKYLASKNGKLYYTVGCKASNRIKEENRIWFETAADAEKLGLTASPSCK